MAKLTQQLVERATGPATGQRFLRDTRVAGLALRVTSGGAKAWGWEGRVRGRGRRVTLGPYPALSLAQAPEHGLSVAGARAHPVDPAAAPAPHHAHPTVLPPLH